MPPPRDIPPKDILQTPAPVVRRAAASAPPAPAASAGAAAAPLAAAPASRPARTDPELEARKARADAEAKAKAAADEQRIARQRAENCQRARQQLALLQSGQRVVRVDARGEQFFLDDQARATETAEARRVIDSECR